MIGLGRSSATTHGSRREPWHKRFCAVGAKRSAGGLLTCPAPLHTSVQGKHVEGSGVSAALIKQKRRYRQVRRGHGFWQRSSFMCGMHAACSLRRLAGIVGFASPTTGLHNHRHCGYTTIATVAARGTLAQRDLTHSCPRPCTHRQYMNRVGGFNRPLDPM